MLQEKTLEMIPKYLQIWAAPQEILLPQASYVTVIDPDPLEQNTAVYPKKYWHLNAESKELDLRLFHTVVVIIEGPLRDVVTDLKGKYSRYVLLRHYRPLEAL